MRLASFFSHESLFRAFLVLSCSFMLSCSSNPVDENLTPTDPATLTVSPTHASPGATLTISGAAIDTSTISSYQLIIGGQQTFLITDSAGGMVGVAPVFFADTAATWPTAPDSALDIELFKDSVLIGKGVGIFTLDSLVPAPGATQSVVTNTISTIESYKTILAALPSEPSLLEQMTVGLMTALDSLMYGRGDSSLSVMLTDLQTSNPNALAFLDAIYAANGAADQTKVIADAMAAIAAELNSGALRRGQVTPPDIRLAATMQLASMLKLFGDSFIHGAAGTAGDISFGLGMVPSAGLIPGFRVIATFAAVTSTITSMVDLIFNKIIVASLPTVIDSFTITLTRDTIAVGDTTVSSLRIYARNSPLQITLTDLLSQFSGIIGLLSPSGPPPTLLQQLEGVLNYVLGQLNNALQDYHNAHPEFAYNPIFFDIGGIPIIRKDAEINDPRLLDLFAVSARLAVIDSLLEWRSTGDPGSASVTIAPSFSQDATLIPIPSFLGYVGSSFGILSDSSALISAAQQITIKKNLALLVDFAPAISRDGANVLGVRAGEIGIAGDTIWLAGLDVSLLAVGGGATPATGTTDATGQFSSIVSLDPLSDTVEVVVTVTRSTGGFATATVKAIVEDMAQDTIPRIAFLSNRGGTWAFWRVWPFDTTTVKKLRNSGSANPFNLRWAPGYTMFSYTDIGNNGLESYFVRTDGVRRRIGSDLTILSTTSIPWAETDSSLFVYAARLSGGLPKIFTENPFTGARDTLYNDALGNVGMPRLSPDGQFIAFTVGSSGGGPATHTIYRGSVDGSSVIMLVPPTEGAGISDLAWSANGADIIYTYLSPAQTPRIVRKVPASGGAVVTLGSHGTVSSLHTIPGTRKIVFAAGPSFPGVLVKEGIFVQDLDDLTFEILPNTAINVQSIGVSPDGLYICYDDGTSGPGRNIYMIELATGTRTQLTADGFSHRVTWSRW